MTCNEIHLSKGSPLSIYMTMPPSMTVAFPPLDLESANYESCG